MGRRGSGAWLDMAAEVAAECKGKSSSERQKVVDGYATARGLNPISVRRISEAYEYVIGYVDPDGVKAPVAAIEVLQRIERRNALLSANLRPRVFAGDITIRELLEQERETVRLQEIVSEHARTISLEEIFRFVSDLPEYSEQSRGLFGQPTPTAVWVGANHDDRETKAAGGVSPSWALLVSPRVAISRLLGCTFDDLIRAIVLASALYRAVFVFAASKDEKEQIVEIIRDYSDGDIQNVSVITCD